MNETCEWDFVTADGTSTAGCDRLRFDGDEVKLKNAFRKQRGSPAPAPADLKTPLPGGLDPDRAVVPVRIVAISADTARWPG